MVPLMLAAPSAAAQRRRPPEFAQQGILVANFWVTGKETPSVARADMRFGRKAGDAVRDRLAHLVNKKEAKVIDGRQAANGWPDV